MNFLTTYAKEIIALLVPLVVWVLNTRLKSKPRLVWWSPHAFNFLIQEPLRDAQGNIIAPTQLVKTASILIMNMGREPAHKVEIVFNWKPQYLNIWPIRSYSEPATPDNRHVLIFDSLSPKETLNIELLAAAQNTLPELINLRCDQCLGANIAMAPYPVLQKWKVNMFLTCALFGVAAIIYIAIVVLQFILLETPPAL